MGETSDHLAAIRGAMRKLQQGDQRRAQARAKQVGALVDAVDAARAAGYPVETIIEVTGMKRATFYRRMKGSQDG